MHPRRRQHQLDSLAKARAALALKRANKPKPGHLSQLELSSLQALLQLPTTPLPRPKETLTKRQQAQRQRRKREASQKDPVAQLRNQALRGDLAWARREILRVFDNPKKVDLVKALLDFRAQIKLDGAPSAETVRTLHALGVRKAFAHVVGG